MRGRLLIALALVILTAPARADDTDTATVRALAVQQALGQGRGLLKDGQAEKAVETLERELPYINGNGEYLAALQDAYAALVKKLDAEAANERAEVYRKKLRILNPEAPVAEAKPVALTPAPGLLPPPLPAPPVVLPPAPIPVDAPTPKRLPRLADLTAPTLPAAQSPAAVSAPDTPEPKSERRVRAQVDDDPFQKVPEDQKRAAVELAGQGDAAFVKGDFATAGQLYQQATAAEPGMAAGRTERIAYCRVDAVVRRLNQPNAGPLPLAEMEREVKDAQPLLPKMDSFVQKVLGEIATRKGTNAGVAVPTEAGWVALDTANYRILHRNAPQLAEQAAKVAEQVRTAMYERWFGNAGANWSPRCTLYLHVTAADYAQATGKPNGSPGHATFRSDAGRVTARQLDMRADDPGLLTDTLPHEATHVVLADLFGDQQLPRWADEGMAVLSESPARLERYKRALERFAREGRLLQLSDLLQRNELPTDPETASVVYVQSVSVAEFLCAQKGHAVFASLLREAPRRGLATVIQRTYGFRDLNELQVAWLRACLPAGGQQ